MKKTIYSLMLFDDLIEEVDREAYMKGTNRSQVINDILAEHFGLQTPEQKIQSVLENLEANFEKAMSIGQIVNNTSIRFGKSLKYKYRPKLRYSYEFVGSGSEKYAVLKVSSRTTSRELSDHLDRFFERIAKTEQNRNLTEGCCGNDAGNHRFVREFRNSSGMDQDVSEITACLTRYLKTLDQAMNQYFSDPDDLEDFDRILNELYDNF